MTGIRPVRGVWRVTGIWVRMRNRDGESEDQVDEKGEEGRDAIENESARPEEEAAGQSHLGYVEKYG